MTTITTVDKHIDSIVESLSTTTAVRERAERFAEEHGDDAKATHVPRVVAAGAVYAATCVHDTGATQADVADAADVSRQATGNAYRTILNAYDRDQRR